MTLVGVVEQGSVSTFSDPDFMNSVIERLAEYVLADFHVPSCTSDKAS